MDKGSVNWFPYLNSYLLIYQYSLPLIKKTNCYPVFNLQAILGVYYAIFL